jgi:hypothetical protein
MLPHPDWNAIGAVATVVSLALKYGLPLFKKI